MRKYIIKALLKKEYIDYTREPATFASLLFLPLVLGIVFPASILLLMQSEQVKNDFFKFTSVTEHLLSVFETPYTDSIASISYIFLIKLMTPAFLLIPVITATTLASSSFAGEKTEKTLEGLLLSPCSPRELMLGKILASFLPAVFMSWIAIIFYSLTIGFLGYPLFKSRFIIDEMWIFTAVVLVPLISFLVVLIVVHTSRRAKTVKSAQSVASLLILPVLALVIGQAAGAIFIGWAGAIIFALITFLANLILLMNIKKLSTIDFL